MAMCQKTYNDYYNHHDNDNQEINNAGNYHSNVRKLNNISILKFYLGMIRVLLIVGIKSSEIKF